MKTMNARLWKNILVAALIIFLILLPFFASQYTITTFIRIIYFGFLGRIYRLSDRPGSAWSASPRRHSLVLPDMHLV